MRKITARERVRGVSDRDSLPHNLESERQVLGSCMLSREALDTAALQDGAQADVEGNNRDVQ